MADFLDPEIAKVVELQEKCKQQQVSDGAFSSVDQVPKTAITLAIPALLSGSGRYVCCIVPGVAKAEAVRASLNGPVSTTCPASILKRHFRTTLYLDQDAASLL